jgi:hypothetical protein
MKENPTDLKHGDKIYTYDVDLTTQTGTLKYGKCGKQPDEYYGWYVDYDDGESYLVLNWGLIHLQRSKL